MNRKKLVAGVSVAIGGAIAILILVLLKPGVYQVGEGARIIFVYEDGIRREAIIEEGMPLDKYVNVLAPGSGPADNPISEWILILGTDRGDLVVDRPLDWVNVWPGQWILTIKDPAEILFAWPEMEPSVGKPY